MSYHVLQLTVNVLIELVGVWEYGGECGQLVFWQRSLEMQPVMQAWASSSGWPLLPTEVLIVAETINFSCTNYIIYYI